MAIEQKAHPWEFNSYLAEAGNFRLSGVHCHFGAITQLPIPRLF
jgi:hypothetical protein